MKNDDFISFFAISPFKMHAKSENIEKRRGGTLNVIEIP